MSVWDYIFDCAEQRLGDALVQLFRIDCSTFHTEEQLTTSELHAHQFYELHVASEGSFTYHISGKDVPLQAGEMLVIRPDCLHYSVGPENGYVYSVLGLRIARIGTESGHFYDVLTSSLNQATEQAIPLPAPIVERIHRYAHAAPSSSIRQYCRRQLKACEIIISLFEAVVDEDSPYVATDGTDLSIMLDTFVNNRYLTLQEMADRLNYSPRHLARIIKRRYGKTLREMRAKKGDTDL